MRAAAAIGTTLAGERPTTRSRVEHGTVVLHCRWPGGPTALRGAVVAALGGPAAHVDLHGHAPDGTGRQARATVCYRVEDERPVVWAYGPRALAHLRAVAAVESLDDATGRAVLVESAELRTDATSVGLHDTHWYRYEVTDYYPSTVAGRCRPYPRRPCRRPVDHELAAWAGRCLADSIARWLADVGVVTERAPSVHVVAVQHEALTWRRCEPVQGFRARVVSDAILPDGLGLGQHVAEGFGVVRCATP